MSDLSIQELQIKQTFLERHIEEQDRVIYDMQRDVEKLRKEVAKLAQRAEMIANNSGEDLPADERPPHY